MRAPRLADVAERAGVSEATVSRVLNGKPGVAESTRTAVLAAVDMLGYDRPAKLRRASAGLVGLIVPELVNPVFPGFVQVIEGALAAHAFTPILCTQTPGGIAEDDYVQMMCERGVSGIIFISGLHADTTADLDRYHQLRTRGLPFVLINGYRENVDAACVSCDDVAAMHQAVAHLTSLGHRRIGLATGPERFVPVQRSVTGFRQAMAQLAGISEVDRFVATTWYTVEGGAEAASRLVDQGCTALVFGSDIMALGAVQEIRRRGLDVPGDISVIGHDDSPLIAFTDPPLTTLRQDVDAMGHAAVVSLLGEIEGRPAPRADLVFHAELVERGSTAPVPSRPSSSVGTPVASSGENGPVPTKPRQ
ncbi:transcriptional regulator, LacI family [Austwickia chelonae]|uniref:Putative LacI family transcriptional regulator n=1 Tax=Austwickia chelonae NBRC 105200 TaxID=1184607 RepID=K6W7N6_9MICO|nr:LacI family DNA-binding transcriptional regulator [Austwickia chelonae]GAB77842.1 putative LacI family transcriptional regulator [Austwickia chelonae NBRC 105200]SEV90645.1 transcriptional regulator, LacI family [Austwickia chelonae]